MPEIAIESADDRRLDPYRDLKSPESRRRDTFVAEGEKLVLRLIDSPCETESILCTVSVRDRFRGKFPDRIPIYIASTPVISGLIGFQFHRGVLACGRRPPAVSLATLCQARAPAEKALIIACPEIRDPTNLGTIIRTAAAFGASGLVAGLAGTDPFSRRVLRTSMGSVLRLPIVQTDDWHLVLETLHHNGFETTAAVVDSAAGPLAAAHRPLRVALLFGNEDEGLPAQLVHACRRRVTLPMARGVDSLNVAVAAGIVICHFADLPPGGDAR
jgi:tRNA G18 (ribose-2'-O)-methylase SpoU